ncbi:CoA ester lyase [Nakamurella flava]|uniref:CoA ester lyase n=1 Tax=Nakamurella flava TaxID=2576308 RepID=A0A4U6QBC4_9ACTN|nr:CoA ester lyase [Nakamurella flava]TKV57281.1 CoA ester lyase [Nakamurella flava]
MSATSPVARTLLFVPGDRPALFAKALTSGVDAIVLDLEDAVAFDAKPAARDAVGEFLRSRSREIPTGPQVWVRVNAVGSDEGFRDVAALADVLTHVRVPKVETPDQIDALAGELPHLVATLPAIESAAGLLAAPQIARHPLVTRLGLGGVDLCRDLGCADTALGLALPRATLVVASRAAGLPGPVNSVWTRLDDADGLVAHAQAAKDLGFAGQSLLSPRQLSPVRSVFGVSEDERAWATEVLAAFTAAGEAATRTPSGHFVDLPVAQRAQRLLAEVG